MKSLQDLPAIPPLIKAANPQDGSEWLVLEAYYIWEQPTLIGEERFEFPQRQIWYGLQSYIVKKCNVDSLFEWAKEQRFMGGWMPKSHGLISVFLGEFFWAPAFKYHDIPYYHHDGWTDGWDHQIPREVLVSTDQYLQESGGYDCSIDDTIGIYLPARWIADQMGLRWNGVGSDFFDDNGNLMAFDPSVQVSGPGALLMNRDALERFLLDNGYDIIWTVIGEKNVIGVSISRSRLELSGTYRRRGPDFEEAIRTKFQSSD